MCTAVSLVTSSLDRTSSRDVSANFLQHALPALLKKVPLLTRHQTYHQCDRTPHRQAVFEPAHPQPTDPSWRSTQLKNPTKTNILLAFGTQRYTHEGTVYSVTNVTAEKTRILSLAQFCTKPNSHHLQYSRQCKLMSCAHFNCPCSWVCNSNRAGFNGGNIYTEPYKMRQMSAKILTLFVPCVWTAKCIHHTNECKPDTFIRVRT